MTSNNNYVPSFMFTQPPPPNYNLNNSWNYNWPPHSGQNRSGQNRNSAAPPLPPGPPPQPPPPPPPPSDSRTSSNPLSSTTKVEQTPSAYYHNSTPQGTYRVRRYNPTSAQYNNSGCNQTGQYALPSGQYPAPMHYPSPPGQYGTQQGQYPGQYNPGSVMYMPNGSVSYARNYYNKRKLDPNLDPNMKKQNKKRKKPLSQNVPQRKDWSVVDAKKALMVEREYNKRHRSQSLIIKFPDLDLNREIVSKFHSSIETVHFQQPSTPRFCFVTIKDSADPESVIKDLNKIPFGQGYLTAEFKKDREDELNIGPEDIDPLTLYVGNLAQEVTKEDMLNAFPKQRRIDIGYAKKMKYTRYAFVSFKNVEDTIEAFKRTHATQMHSKSLIVRFRRMNGTVGMPGEPKPQMPNRSDAGDHHNGSLQYSNSDHNSTDPDLENHHHSPDIEASTNSSLDPFSVDVTQWEACSIKQEPEDRDSEEEKESKPDLLKIYSTPYLPGDFNLAFSQHKPIMVKELKKEDEKCSENFYSSIEINPTEINFDKINENIDEQLSARLSQGISARHRTLSDIDTDSDSSILPPDKIKKEKDDGFSQNTYETLKILNLASLNRDIKKEPGTEMGKLDLRNSESPFGTNEKDTLSIKSEPVHTDAENDGDEDDSSDVSDVSDSTNFKDRFMKWKKRIYN